MQATGPIEEKLQAIKGRLAARALLDSSAQSIGTAVLMFVILTWTTAWNPTAVLYASVAVSAFTFIMLTALRLLRLPGPVPLAQRVDSHFMLDERLSAAVEGQTSGMPGLMADLQRQDALNCLQQVDPVAMIPVRLSRPGTGLLATAAALLIAMLALPSTADPVTAAPTTQRELGQWEKDKLAEEITRVAETLTADARDLGNDYLGAVARSLESLAQQLSHGEVSRPELITSLSRITEHLTLADHSATAHIERLIELSQQELAEPPANSAALGESEAAGAPTDSHTQQAAQEEPPVPIRELNAGGDATSESLSSDPALEVNAEDLRDAPRLLSMEDNSATSRHYMEPDPEMVARLEERRQQMIAEGAAPDGAVPVGAAQQSTAGDGDVGGEGTGETSAVEQSETDFVFGADAMQLPTSANNEGQRITVAASPDTVFTETDGAVQFAFSHWLPSDEAPLDQTLIGLHQQDSVRRYFLPPHPEVQQLNQKGSPQ